MPSATPGGWPYPTPPEAVREGAANIQALATENEKRLGAYSVIGAPTVCAFDSNGLWYFNWSTWGITWTGNPAVVAMAGQTTTGNDAGVNIQIYQPHTNAGTLVLQANYTKDGRMFSGNIDVYIMATGRKA